MKETRYTFKILQREPLEDVILGKHFVGMGSWWH
jgi:hypothetical protein